MNPDAPLSIGDVARRAQLRPSAIRYYERVGLIPPPPRSSGRRRYREEVFETLRLIRLAQAAGFTVGEVRTLLHGFGSGTRASDRWRSLTRRKLADVSERIAQGQRMQRLLESLSRCQCETLSQCVRPQLVTLGARPRSPS